MRDDGTPDPSVQVTLTNARSAELIGKFWARFGLDALRFVNSKVERELNLRGVNARIVQGGAVRPGEAIRKASAA